MTAPTEDRPEPVRPAGTPHKPMLSDLDPFGNSFSSIDVLEGSERAVIDWATNTMVLKIPASDEVELAVAAGFVLPEETLHSQWNVAMINTVAHLILAADDALAQYLSEEHSPNPDATDPLVVMQACQETVDQLLSPMGPFVEAVDKFQIVTVLRRDQSIRSALQDALETEHDQETAEAFEKRFRESIEGEEPLLTGDELHVSDDRLYVNPFYFHALSDVALRDWETGGETMGDVHSERGRGVAEAVARATLEVPFPVTPLGGQEFADVDSLSVPEDLPAPRTVTELEAQYEVSPVQFENYVKPYLKDIDAEEFTYTIDDLRDDWVAKVFVNVLDALEELHTATEFDVGSAATDDLCNRLIEEVHSVDPSQPTMRNHLTALREIAQTASPSDHDEDFMGEEGSTLSKILLASFEQYGSFGGVVYGHTEGDIMYELNWHAKPEKLDSEKYTHVPDGVDNYADLWRHYYFYEGLRHFIVSGYRELLINELVDAHERSDELETALEEAAKSVDGTLDTDRAAGAAATPASEDAAELREAHEQHKASTARKTAKQYPTAVLQHAADNISTTPILLTADDIPCPLCAIQDGTCGPSNECKRFAEREAISGNIGNVVR